MAYSLIESADEWKARERKKIRFETLQKAIIIIIILIFGTFIAAQLIVQSIHNGSLLSTPTSAIYRSLPGTVQLINGTFRTAIGGQFHCSRRLLIPSPTAHSLLTQFLLLYYYHSVTSLHTGKSNGRKSSPPSGYQVHCGHGRLVFGRCVLVVYGKQAIDRQLQTGYLSWTERMADDERWVPNAVGNSFITGGDGEMEGHLTLANILRRLNPSLTGFSTGIGLQEEQSGLNVAVPGMWVDDLQRQARELIRRFRKFSEESLKNEWKLIHIFIGSRDIGGYCEGQGETTKADYKRNFTLAITTLQEALPKTIISIIGLANMDFLFNAASIIRGTKFRPCKNIDFQLLAQRRIDQYREANIEIIAEMGLKSRPDHVVITHNIFDDLWQPLRKADGSFNIEFYAEDLYHLSNYGNSLIAKQLWNQLNSPEQRKLTTNALLTDESRELQCPEYRCPFIRTPSNSVHCVMSDENVIAGTYTDVDFR